MLGWRTRPAWSTKGDRASTADPLRPGECDFSPIGSQSGL